MTTALIVLLAACAPQPASIQFADAGTSTVFDKAPVALPAVQVLDAQGQAIEPAPPVTWSATPEGLVELDPVAGTATPVAEGAVEIVAQVGEVKGTWALQVSLPDEVRVAGAPQDGAAQVGTPFSLTAVVYDGEHALNDMAITWNTSDEKVATVVDGVVTPVGEGEVIIAATGGGHATSVPLTVTVPTGLAAVAP